MARYPGALWRLLSKEFIPSSKITAYNRVNLHVAVSEADSLYGFFNQPKRASSHFYVRKSGVVEQYIDTATRGEADLEGNDATISVETQGGLKDANREPWTEAQVVALGELVAWLHKEHGIPLRLAKDSKIGESSHGVSWHRLGIDGAFPELPSPLAGREQRGGGMRYSNARGKSCPGNAKINQIPDVLAVAKAIANPPKPSKPIKKKDRDMHIIRLHGGTNPARKYALVSGGHAIEIGRKTYVAYRKAGYSAIQVEAKDYARIVGTWR